LCKRDATLAKAAAAGYAARMLNRLKQWARALKRDVLALYLAARDPRVPWYAKALALVTAAYALSPIDLIPDFIPVLGYLDDLILLPGLIWLTVRLIPTPLSGLTPGCHSVRRISRRSFWNSSDFRSFSAFSSSW